MEGLDFNFENFFGKNWKRNLHLLRDLCCCLSEDQGGAGFLGSASANALHLFTTLIFLFQIFKQSHNAPQPPESVQRSPSQATDPYLVHTSCHPDCHRNIGQAGSWTPMYVNVWE